jgi:hypothetical protein
VKSPARKRRERAQLRCASREPALFALQVRHGTLPARAEQALELANSKRKGANIGPEQVMIDVKMHRDIP